MIQNKEGRDEDEESRKKASASLSQCLSFCFSSFSRTVQSLDFARESNYQTS